MDERTPTTPLAEYTYYPGLDQPQSLRRRMRSDSVFYFAQDFPGNVVGLVNSAQSLVAQYKYKPYGGDDGSSPGSVPNPFRFAARQFDTETGLYLRAGALLRPGAGRRFVSEDPIGLAGGINAYVYCAQAAEARFSLDCAGARTRAPDLCSPATPRSRRRRWLGRPTVALFPPYA